MNYTDFQKLVFDKAQDAGLTEYELYYESDDSLELSVFKDEISSFSSSLNASCGFRVVYNGHIGNASTSLFSEYEAERLVSHAIENAACIEKDEPLLFAQGGGEYAVIIEDEPLPADGNLLASAAGNTLKFCREKDSRVSETSTVSAFCQGSTVKIDNSNGIHLSSTKHFGGIIPQIIAADGEENSSGYDIKLGNPAEIDITELAHKVVDKTTSGLGAKVPDSGNIPVVFSGDAMADLLGVFSAAFSGENALNGLSAMKNKEGETIASEVVTLVDNPLCDKSIFRCHFDGEGTPSYSKNVIEKGILKTLLYDMASAARAGKTSTGNARRSVTSPISVSPTVMYIECGTNKPEDLYSAAGDGILVTELNGLHAGANFVTGDFSLQSAGFIISGGKKSYPVKSFAVAGNFYDMLKHIVMIADDLEFGYSRFSSPSVLVDKLTVSGK